MRKSLFIAFVLAVALSLPGMASARDLGKIFTDCGLGGLIGNAVQDKGTGDILAIVTNITWDLGTTATSSEVTTPDSCARGSAKAAKYIYENYDYLAADLAEGAGTHVVSLLGITGCEGAIWSGAKQDLRAELAVLATDANYPQYSRFEHADKFFTSYIKTLKANYPGKCDLS